MNSHQRLTSRPYEPGRPRACIQPTCGPVRTSVHRHPGVVDLHLGDLVAVPST